MCVISVINVALIIRYCNLFKQHYQQQQSFLFTVLGKVGIWRLKHFHLLMKLSTADLGKQRDQQRDGLSVLHPFGSTQVKLRSCPKLSANPSAHTSALNDQNHRDILSIQQSWGPEKVIKNTLHTAVTSKDRAIHQPVCYHSSYSSNTSQLRPTRVNHIFLTLVGAKCGERKNCSAFLDSKS